MNFYIINYDEGDLIINNNILSDPKLKVNDFALRGRWRYRVEDDLIGTSLEIQFRSSKNEVILSYSITLTILLLEWGRFLSKQFTREELENFMKPVWIDTIGFARGILALRLKDTKLKYAILPSIDIADFLHDVIVIKEASDTSKID